MPADTAAVRTVLLACARRVCATDHPGDLESAVRTLADESDGDGASGGDWEALLQTAADEGMFMLLTRQLQQADLMRLAPPDVRARYLGIRREGTARALAMCATLIRTLERLAATGVRAMPWKGPTLAEITYGDATARHFVDLDILLYPADVPRAVDALEEAGWQRRIEADIGPMESFMRTECELGFVEPTRGTSLEIHWALQPSSLHSSQSVDGLWRRAGSVSLLGRSLPCPGPADTFIGLAAHAAKHGWLAIEPACALGSLVAAHPETDWAAVIEQARLVGCYRRCLLAAAIIHDSLAITLPQRVMRAARADRGVVRLAAGVHRNWNTGSRGPRLAGTAGQIAWTASTFDRRGQGTRYAVSTVFGAQVADRAVFALPRPMEPLYAALRPARLVGKYAQRAVLRGAGRVRRERP